MTLAITFFGFLVGILTAIMTVYVYNRLEENRDNEERFWREQKIRSDMLKRAMNDPRDRLEQNIYEQTRKEIQEREENK